MAGQVKWLLGAVDVGKTTDQNDINPLLFKHCSIDQSAPLATLFLSYLSEKKWPSIRKVSIHITNLRNESTNCRPISLLSVMGKVLEQLVTAVIYLYLDENLLFSNKQFDFRLG